ncbi:MAG: hypothetical protein MSH10_05125 [Pygmaiobacter massiliensis]|nr:hypothetical protein [Pygmaiobacter massiliensis]
MHKEPDCRLDCFHCPYPDCVVDGVFECEKKQLEEIEAQICQELEQDEVFRLARYRKAYYQAHRQQLIARQASRRAKDRAAYNAYYREYRRKRRLLAK